MGKGKRKSGKIIAIAIIASVLIAFVVAVLILNAFIPVKYLTAYTVKKQLNKSGDLRVTYINVDFGDSILIEFPDGKSALIDGGDGAYANTKEVLTHLNRRGINKIDYLICTSVKKEHCGGLAEIIKSKKVGQAFIPYCENAQINQRYADFTAALENKKISYSYAEANEGFCSEEYGYFLTFLSPVSHQSSLSAYAVMNADPTPTNVDNASAVVWLEYCGTAFIFASDAREDALTKITEGYALSRLVEQPFCKFNDFSVELEKCKIITVAGHGGEHNFCADWYDCLSAEVAIVSVGKNYAGYPSTTVVATINNSAKTLYTKYSGSISVTLNADGYTVEKEK